MYVMDLGLTRFQSDLQLRRQDDEVFVFDLLRKKYLLLTPEEWVRQLFIRYLLLEKDYPAGRLSVEQSLRIQGHTRRVDLLAYDAAGLPFLLVECKAPEVRFTQRVFDQVAAYNRPLRAPYILMTNGPETICCRMLYGEGTDRPYVFLDHVPG